MARKKVSRTLKPKAIPPAKSSSGEGFTVEDRVAALCAANLLLGRGAFSQLPGRLIRIEFQVAVDGWTAFNDLLLTLEDTAGTYRAAVSIRSKREITGNRFSPDVKAGLVTQFTKQAPNPFMRERDRLVLVAAEHGNKIATTVRALTVAARGHTAQLPTRIKEPGFTNDTGRAIFADLDGYRQSVDACAITAADLLAPFVLEELPLESLAQPDPASGLALCRDLLRSPDTATTLDLWEALSKECRRQKQAPGYLDIPRLLDALRRRFHLKGYPYDSGDWAKLEADSRGNLDNIQGKIAGHRLPRQASLDALAANVTAHSITVLVGPSGCGKTSLAKHYFEQNSPGYHQCLWTRVQAWPRTQPGTMSAALGLPVLTHDLSELFTRVSGPALVLVDGVEHCTDAERIGTLARLLRLCRSTDSTSRWRVILLARAEDWSAIREQLAITARNIPIHACTLGDFEPDELFSLVARFPKLRPFAQQPHLVPLLRKPKIAALVTEHLAVGGEVDPSALTSEPHLARWFWQDRIRRGEHAPMRARAARFLAEKQADLVQPEIPEAAIETALLPICAELDTDGIFVSRQGRLAFQHDLYGDWARLEILIAEQANWSDFVAPLIASPYWHRAARLYGIWLLEQASDGLTQWSVQVTKLRASDASAQLLADLLLEAPIFSSAPQENLERVWPRLIDGGGELLRRMFGRIQLSASAPNEAMIDFFASAGISRDFLIPQFRMPYPQYWIPLLRVLHAHLDNALSFATLAVARTTQSWLDYTTKGWQGRAEAAELAITNAERVVAKGAKGPNRQCSHDEYEGPIYKAAMTAMPDHPLRVAVLLKKLARLLPPDDRLAFPKDRWITRHTGMGTLSDSGVTYELPPPWPGGPFEEPDRAFRHLVLNTNALVPVMRIDPALAREVALAVCLQPPEVEDWYNRHDHGEPQELARDDTFQPPFYTRGPFLALLQVNPKEGMALVVALVNFFTDRWLVWAKRHGARMAPVVTTEPDGPKTWRGDHRLYFAFRDAPTCNHFVVSALMALEKWFADRIAKEENVEADVAKLLIQSDSLALAGLLIAVGKAQPNLLFTALWPLVCSPAVHALEYYYFATGLGARPRFNASALEQETITKWEDLPQHRVQLHEACRQCLPYPHAQAKLAELAANWKSVLQQPDQLKVDASFVRHLAELFDSTNWKPEPTEGGELWHYHAPADLLASAATRQAQSSAQMSLLTIPIECRSLLEKGSALAPADLEKWYATLDQLPKEPVMDDDRQHMIASFADAQCGIIAVLVHCGADWLKQAPAKAARCREIVLGHLANPPPPRRFMHDDTALNHTWENFAAEVTPVFLAQNLGSADWRHSLAELAGREHLETVRILFRRSFAVRAQLGSLFTQLIHLAIWVAAARRIIHITKYEKKKPLDWATWWVPQREAFAAGKVADPPADWESIKLISVEMVLRQKNRTWANIDLAVMVAALDWLRTLTIAADATERTRWLGWAQSLMASVIATVPLRAEARDGAPLPNRDEEKALDFIGRFCATLLIDSERRSLWEPLFALGESGSHYTRDFLREFFPRAFQDSSSHLKAAWEEMLNWAWAADSWDWQKADRAQEIRELWWTLLLIDSSSRIALTAAHAPLIEAMKPHYAKWAALDLKDTWSAQRFLGFLREPAAEPLFSDAIVWLNQQIERDPKLRWRREDLLSHLSDFAVWAWTKHEARLRASAAAFAAFKEILVLLAAEQDQPALALLARVASG